MPTMDLDDIDRGILHLLQEDARNLSPVDMAKELPVSEGTVRNRIERLEDSGVIEGYVPHLNYEAAGYTLQVAFTCTVPVSQQAELAERTLEIERVVNVQEMVASRGNLRVTGVATTLDEVLQMAEELSELGLQLVSQKLVRSERVRPFNHFDIEKFPDG